MPNQLFNIVSLYSSSGDTIVDKTIYTTKVYCSKANA